VNCLQRARRAVRLLGHATIGLVLAPILFIVSIIRPFRIGAINGMRIGHLSFESSQYRALYAGKPGHVFFLSGPICNVSAGKIFTRGLLILPECLLRVPFSVFRRSRILRDQLTIEPVGYQFDSGGRVYKLDSPVFSEFELGKAKEQIAALPIDSELPWVTLHVRDQHYLDAQYGRALTSHHDYRDASVDNYEALVSLLVAAGFMVLRVGSSKSPPAGFDLRGYYDYGLHSATPLLDLYIIRLSRFMIATNSGPSNIAYCFKIPILYVNVCPVLGNYGFAWNQHITIFKKYYSRRLGRLLDLSEIFFMGLGMAGETSEFDEHEITLIENTSEEIAQAGAEFLVMLEGKCDLNDADQQLLERYRNVILEVHQGGRNYDRSLIPTPAVCFLKSNPWLLR